MVSTSSPQLRGLFCGAGHFAQIQLAAWQQVPGARIVALYNRTLSRARALQGEFDLEQVSDAFESLLDAVRPDFVDICTAVETHLPLVRMAAKRGVPILCQKPLGPTMADAAELVAVAQANGCRVMANDNWRWQGWYRELQRLLASGVIGQPRHARFVLRPGDGWGDTPYPLQPFFRDMPRFLLLETGGHYLDTMRYLLGDLSAVYCVTRRRNPAIRGEDAALVTVEFKSGVTAIFDADRTAATETTRPPTNGHVTIEGEAGTLRLDEQGGIFVARRGRPETKHDYSLAAGYRGGSAIAAQAHFVTCLSTGRPFETEAAQYLAIERAVQACYDSAANGTRITLTDFP